MCALHAGVLTDPATELGRPGSSYVYSYPMRTKDLFYSGYALAPESCSRENSGALDLWVRIWGIADPDSVLSLCEAAGLRNAWRHFTVSILTEGFS